jgi:hypothetical protein
MKLNHHKKTQNTKLLSFFVVKNSNILYFGREFSIICGEVIATSNTLDCYDFDHSFGLDYFVKNKTFAIGS